MWRNVQGSVVFACLFCYPEARRRPVTCLFIMQPSLQYPTASLASDSCVKSGQQRSTLVGFQMWAARKALGVMGKHLMENSNAQYIASICEGSSKMSPRETPEDVLKYPSIKSVVPWKSLSQLMKTSEKLSGTFLHNIVIMRSKILDLRVLHWLDVSVFAKIPICL